MPGNNRGGDAIIKIGRVNRLKRPVGRGFFLFPENNIVSEMEKYPTQDIVFISNKNTEEERSMPDGNGGSDVVVGGSEPEVSISGVVKRVNGHTPCWLGQLTDSLRNARRRNGSERRQHGSERRRAKLGAKVSVERRGKGSDRRTRFGRRLSNKVTARTVQNQLVHEGFIPSSIGIRAS